MEADLMRRVLPPAEFPAWFRRYLADLEKGGAEDAADAGEHWLASFAVYT
jgi:hypothetical protein